jgi:dipeptidyl aminopeptidase/acylaminoacyl peptidase
MPTRVANYVGGTPAQYPERYKLLSPMTHVTRNSPPTLLIHGAADTYVPLAHTELMAARLMAVGAPHDVLVIPYAEHSFDFVFGGLGEQLAEHAVMRFLRR